jgi:hypothetical protein
MTVLVASRLKIPTSTTHCVVGSVFAVGLADGIKAVNWRYFFTPSPPPNAISYFLRAVLLCQTAGERGAELGGHPPSHGHYLRRCVLPPQRNTNAMTLASLFSDISADHRFLSKQSLGSSDLQWMNSCRHA